MCFSFPKATTKIKPHGSIRAEGVKGATADIRLFSLPPCRLRRGEIPACGKELLYLAEQQVSRAHLARQCAARWGKQLGGASEEAQSYWQGRFAACAFVDCSL